MNTELQTNEVVEMDKQEKKRKGRGLQILLITFLILFLLTTALLGARLYEMATRDQYTVDLGIGEPEGIIELFRIEYENELGEVTVKGVNADNVVAPGTSVDYDVRLRNKDDVVIDFVMIPTVEYLTEDVVPVEFRVVDTYGNYILGNENEWVSAEEMNALAHKGSVHPDEVFSYHVSWRWVFEVDDDQDAFDTYLGNQVDKEAPGVRLYIETQSVVNITPINNNHMTHLLGEGLGCCWCCYLVWLLVLVCLVLVIWIGRMKKKLNKYEEVVEKYEETMKLAGVGLQDE